MAALERILGDPLQIAVLRWLSAVRGPTSGNAIARRLRSPQSSVRRALERLVEAGVVTRAEIGPSAAYSLNERLAVVRRVILPLFANEEALRAATLRDLARIAERVLWASDPFSAPPARFVALYGSFARGDRDYRDIDLLIVSTSRDYHGRLHDQLVDATAASEVVRRLGVPVSPVIIADADLTGHAELVREVRDNGLALAGVPPAELASIRRYTPPVQQAQ